MLVSKILNYQEAKVDDFNTTGKTDHLKNTLLSGVGAALKDEEMSSNLRSQSNMRGRNSIVGHTSMVKDRDDVKERTREEAARSRQ